MYFLTRDLNENVFSFEKGILLHVRSGQSRRYVMNVHFLSNGKLVIFIYVIISCTQVAWIKQMLHLCGLANVLPAENHYPNHHWPIATAPNGYSSAAANNSAAKLKRILEDLKVCYECCFNCIIPKNAAHI